MRSPLLRHACLSLLIAVAGCAAPAEPTSSESDLTQARPDGRLQAFLGETSTDMGEQGVVYLAARAPGEGPRVVRIDMKTGEEQVVEAATPPSRYVQLLDSGDDWVVWLTRGYDGDVTETIEVWDGARPTPRLSLELDEARFPAPRDPDRSLLRQGFAAYAGSGRLLMTWSSLAPRFSIVDLDAGSTIYERAIDAPSSERTGSASFHANEARDLYVARVGEVQLAIDLSAPTPKVTDLPPFGIVSRAGRAIRGTSGVVIGDDDTWQRYDFRAGTSIALGPGWHRAPPWTYSSAEGGLLLENGTYIVPTTRTDPSGVKSRELTVQRGSDPPEHIAFTDERIEHLVHSDLAATRALGLQSAPRRDGVAVSSVQEDTLFRVDLTGSTPPVPIATSGPQHAFEVRSTGETAVVLWLDVERARPEAYALYQADGTLGAKRPLPAGDEGMTISSSILDPTHALVGDCVRELGEQGLVSRPEDFCFGAGEGRSLHAYGPRRNLLQAVPGVDRTGFVKIPAEARRVELYRFTY